MTTERQGEVYDLGYQRYDGPREGRRRAQRAIFENGVHERLLGAHAVVVTLAVKILLGQRQVGAQVLEQRRHQYEVASEGVRLVAPAPRALVMGNVGGLVGFGRGLRHASQKYKKRAASGPLI